MLYQTVEYQIFNHAFMCLACGLLARKFLATEALSMKQAETFVKAPREGKGFTAWARAWEEEEQPTSKRQRREEPSPSTGSAPDVAGDSLIAINISLVNRQDSCR
jgi:hypothetical protein